jgi:TonB family protein
MSAAEHTMDSEHGDSRRLLAAFLAAVLAHIILFAVFAIVRLTQSPAELAPVSVELMPGTLSGPLLPGPPAPAAPQARAQPSQSSGGAQGFVIPQPRQNNEATMPSGPAFRVVGPNSSQNASAPQATSPVQEPVLPHVSTHQQGTAAAPGGGGTETGAPAQGVLVQGGGQAPVQGSLNVGSLQFANPQGSGAEPGVQSGGGGGGGGGGGAGVSPGGGGQGNIHWDQPEAAKARKLLSSPQPQIPVWVSKQGLTLTVLVSFTLTPDGFLRDVNVEASSGYNEVDAAVMEAVRLWRFSAAPSSRNIHGLIPYVIRAR